EGAFPPPPPLDPFFPVGADDPLERREHQREAERQAFLTALAAGDGGMVVLSAPDSSGGRPTFPSRWLLEAAGDLAGRPLDASAFLTLRPAANPWLRVVRSVLHGVLTAPSPADLEDRRLGEAAAHRRSGGRLGDHALARRADLPLGDGLRVHGLRSSAAFTEVDGNVAAIAASARSLRRIFEGTRPISPTPIERWASCPFRYFLGRVLDVEPTKPPEESWTINPLDRGSLVHDVLEAFFRTLGQEGRPGPGEPYRPEDFALIERLAEAQFVRVEDRGLTGHPFAWENARAAVLADLRGLLLADQAWRVEQGLVPARFEQEFGLRDDAWPALALAADGAQLRFGGKIDRIDLDPVRRRAFVYDYKTGRGDDYEKVADDPVLAGRHLQLALYTRAVRANLGSDYAVEGAYWFVTSRGGFKRHALPDDPARVDARLDEAVDLIARGVRGGLFPQAPGEADRGSFKNCRHCDFDRVCPAGRDDHWQEKQADPGYAFYRRLAEPGGEKA
ncbi:MAG TPA: PD-(D/E)XK nuclease family protein, partial [Chloroflexota bacterium]